MDLNWFDLLRDRSMKILLLSIWSGIGIDLGIKDLAICSDGNNL